MSQRVIHIPLKITGGDIGAHALIDAADLPLVGRWSWRLSEGYARRDTSVDGRSRAIFLHRAILGLEYGNPREGDHINGDRLDNRRLNLRIIRKRVQQQNRKPQKGSQSGMRGVHANKGKWIGRVYLDGMENYLGMFDSAIEADEACKAFRAQHMPFSEDARAA